MRAELEPIWNSIGKIDLPRELTDLFQGSIDDETGAIDLQETYIIDFKDRAPKKFTDDYGASIIRLALAMHNTYGGIIVFGINDNTRLPSGLDVSLNIEAFNACIKEFSGEKFEIVCRRYIAAGGAEISVALVPKRGSARPARLTKKLGPYPSGSLWIRERHEVLVVGAEHFQILYSKRDNYPTEDLQNSAIQRSLPPKPATIKQFVGRQGILMALWDWAIYGDQPRIYLHGPGGSGKSAIAYEFANSISSSASEIRFSSGDRLDYVVFLSAKETELDTDSAKIREFDNRQFSDAKTLYGSLLVESGFRSESEIVDFDEEELEDDIEKMFSE